MTGPVAMVATILLVGALAWDTRCAAGDRGSRAGLFALVLVAVPALGYLAVTAVTSAAWSAVAVALTAGVVLLAGARRRPVPAVTRARVTIATTSPAEAADDVRRAA